ncbi:MAG: hypothetical protein HUN05_23470 [Desulfobacter sp.]|nr:MAG: hypothetical protein HUN05_23470 [Desulfobacter sp.]
MVASFFAGQQSQTMADTLVRYKDKHKEYKDTLELSEAAHVLKSEAAAADGKGDSPPTADKAFRDGMDKVLTGTGKRFSDIVEKKDKKYEVGEDQAQTCIDAISQKKDILSTELQAISTDMDMAVKDSGEAEFMAANAVSNLTDLLGTLGKQAGG